MCPLERFPSSGATMSRLSMLWRVMRESSLGLGWAPRWFVPSILTICWWLNLTMLTMFTLLTPGCISMAKTRCCWSLTSSLKSYDLAFQIIFWLSLVNSVLRSFPLPPINSNAIRPHWLELSLFLSLSSFAEFLSSSRRNRDDPIYSASTAILQHSMTSAKSSFTILR